MSTTAAKLLQEAMDLDESDRARLAVDLLKSVSPPDPIGEADWIAEIERRAAMAIADRADSLPFDEALDRIERDLGL